jgi:hypothetical protein
MFPVWSVTYVPGVYLKTCPPKAVLRVVGMGNGVKCTVTYRENAMRSFKAILSKVPVKVRVRFLESMSFSNGKLVNVRIGDLRGVLRKTDIQALMLSCGCKQNSMCNPFSGECFEIMDSACNPDNCTKEPLPVELGSLLLGTPSHVRQRFLNSLDFENGHLTRADQELVKRHVVGAKIKQLPHVPSK